VSRSSTGRPSLCGLEWVRRKTRPPLPKNPRGTIRLADLFCGCGGLTLGAWEAARVNGYRLDIRLAADTSPDAVNVYRSNFRLGGDVVRETDVCDLLPGKLRNRPRAVEKRLSAAVGALDLLVAGPPCQGHSDLNNHTRRDDPRNDLYLKVIRAVEVLRPRVVLIENVGAVIHDRSRVVEHGLTRLQEMGYRAESRFVRASRLGLPQARKRHILLAVSSPGIEVPELFPKERENDVPISEFVDDLQDEPDTCTDLFRTPSRMTETNQARVRYLFDERLYDLPNHMRPLCHANGHSYKSMYGRLRWDQPAQTITTGFGSMGQGRFVHPTRPRMITPHEAARLQGFPDFFDFSCVGKRTRLQRMIGNAVPPRVVATVVHLLCRSCVL